MVDALDTFSFPPLPPMTRDEYWWAGTDRLAGWGELQVRPHGYSLEQRPLGRVDVWAVTADPHQLLQPFRFATPFPQQVRAYGFLKVNSPELFDRILEAVFHYYPQVGIDYEDAVPEIHSPADLKRFLGIDKVILSELCRDDSAYMGFVFACIWDSEHGLGVMTHGMRVLSIGQSDAASDLGPPLDDGGVFAPNDRV